VPEIEYDPSARRSALVVTWLGVGLGVGARVRVGLGLGLGLGFGLELGLGVAPLRPRRHLAEVGATLRLGEAHGARRLAGDQLGRVPG